MKRDLWIRMGLGMLTTLALPACAVSGLDGEGERSGFGGDSARETEGEIIYGTEVASANTRFRPVAHLEFSKNGVTWECGGTLVGSDWIASAAHCFYANAATRGAGLVDADFQNPANWKISLNRYDETSTAGEARTMKSPPKIHPNFRYTVGGAVRPFSGSDVAVVQLNSPSSYKPLRLVGPSQMAPVAEGGISEPDSGLGARVSAVGWGLTEYGVLPTKLREVQLALTGEGTNCYDPTGAITGHVGSGELCVYWYLGLGNINSGDSGGPILLSVGGVDQVVGINSWAVTPTQVRLSPGVTTRAADVAQWVELAITGNFYLSSGGKKGWTALASSSLGRARMRVGDFDGNGRDDLLYVSGGKWFVRWNAAGNWVEVATDAATETSMLTGDFTGNGTVDVLITTGSGWFIRTGGSGARASLSTSSVLADKLLVGDFDGNGKSDVLYANGSTWRVQYGATGGWVTTRNETSAKASLLVADVDGDGADDVIVTDGSVWRVSKKATSSLTNLTSSATVASQLLVGDFDANGQDDVLYADDKSFRVKYSGQGNWVRLQYTNGTASKLIVGKFDTSSGSDVLQSVR